MKYDVERAITDVINLEGGYVDHPDDPGGATNFGITKARARRAGYRGKMKDMTREWAIHFYAAEEVDSPGYRPIFEISYDVGYEILDASVNVGWPSACAWIQRVLNSLNDDDQYGEDLAVDSKIGPATIGRMTAMNSDIRRFAEIFVRLFDSIQGEHYVSISNSNKRLRSFTKGWALKRIR